MRIKFKASLLLMLWWGVSNGAPAQTATPSSLELLLQTAAPVANNELLAPEVAFAATAVLDHDQVRIDYRIAPGYYLYVNKFVFESATPGAEIGKPLIPLGEIHQDEFFGQTEILRGEASILLPITRLTAGQETLAVRAHSQGCADIGVCYQPYTQDFAVALPTGFTVQPNAATNLTQTAADTSAEEPEILDPDQAFAMQLNTDRPGEIKVSWQIAEGHYLYQERMAFELRNTTALGLGTPQFSKAKPKSDEFFGDMHVFYQYAEATLPVSGAAQAETADLQVRYQGCSEITGVCYPPITKNLTVKISGDGSQFLPIASAQAAPTAPLAEQDQFTGLLTGGSAWFMLAAFFGAGLLLTFTPCVFPMIPILSSIIVGQGHEVSTRRAFSLSLVYVLSMSVAFTLAGVAVGLTGENIQVWLQNPWVLSTMAALFVLLSLSMFGFYQLQMPASVQAWLSQLSNSQKGGTWLGVASMGILSALIVGPCVTPPLVGALIYIAQTGDAALGGAALFMLSLGMGVPLLLLGTSAGRLLPRAGAWMDAVKAVFGVGLLAMAIWMLERILPLPIIMTLWAALLIISAIYLGALEPIRADRSGWFRLWKGLGLISLLAGILLLVGAAGGGTSLLQPLKGVITANAAGGLTNPAHISFVKVKGVAELQQAVAAAQANNQTVLLDFYADWCISCKEMEAFTFSDSGVQAALQNTVLLQTDVTANDAEDQALLKQYGLFGPPAILFFDTDGKERRDHRVVGFMKAEPFKQRIAQAFGS